MATFTYHEDQQGHIVHFYIDGRITAADLTDADTSQDISITGWPANAFKDYAQVMPTATFEDVGTSALTNMAITIGDAGDPDGLLTSFAAADDESPTLATWQGSLGAEANDGALEAAYAPIVRFTSTGANLNTVDQGAINLRVFGHYYKLD